MEEKTRLVFCVWEVGQWGGLLARSYLNCEIGNFLEHLFRKNKIEKETAAESTSEEIWGQELSIRNKQTQILMNKKNEK